MLKYMRIPSTAGKRDPERSRFFTTSEAFKEASGEAGLATKGDIERLEARFEKLETKLSGEMTLLKWMPGILLGGVIGLVMKAFFPV
jgi:hypothetical protein